MLPLAPPAPCRSAGSFLCEQQAAAQMAALKTSPNAFCLFCTHAPLPLVGWSQEDGPGTSHLIICLGSEAVSLCPSLFLVESPVPLLMAWNMSGRCSFQAPSLQSMLVRDVGRLLSVRVGLVCFRGGKQRGKLLSCLGKLCWKENMPYTGVLLLSTGNLGQKEIFVSPISISL